MPVKISKPLKCIWFLFLSLLLCFHVYGVTVGAHYYPWYRPGNFMLNQTIRAWPAIGPYDTSNPAVASQHLDQAAYAGIDVFFLEWTGPNPSDTGRIESEYDIDYGFLPALNSKPYVKYCIFYDQAIRMCVKYGKCTTEEAFYFTNSDVYNTFISDLYHIQTKYFSDWKYFRGNGSPVVWLYLARIYSGNWRGAITEVRNNAGWNIYLIADDLWNTLDPAPRWRRWNYFDAISCYGIGIDGNYYPDGANVRTVADVAIPVYMTWASYVRENGQDFFWPLMAQYDDDHLSGRHYLGEFFSDSKSDFSYFAQRIRSLISDWEYVTVTSFNEWYETSSVETCSNPGYPYRYNWGWDFLSVLREIF